MLVSLGSADVREREDHERTEAPNVLIILTDDQADGTMRLMPRTLRLFERRARNYKNGLVTTPLCCPSRASIFSGRYVHNHGVADNHQGADFKPATSWQRELTEAGYTTGIVGKYLNGWGQDFGGGIPPYFDYWEPDPRLQRKQRRDKLRYRASKRFIRDLETDDERPWALQWSIHAPHVNYFPAHRYRKLRAGSYDRNPSTRERNLGDKARHVRQLARSTTEKEKQRRWRGHVRTLRGADDLVMAMWRFLAKRGERDNTLIIFMSDNGYSLGEHGLTKKGVPYASVVGVPFFLIWDGKIAPGRTPEIAANIDLAPTIYDAVGITPSYEPDGQSLLDSDRREWLFLEGLAGQTWRAYWSHDRHYIRWKRPAWIEDYDRSKDPWQLHARNRRDPVLDAMLSEASACAGTECP